MHFWRFLATIKSLIQIADNVLFDLDENGDIVSIEIMGIKEAETKEGKSLLIPEK